MKWIIKTAIIVFVTLSVLICGCARNKEDESKSIEQLYKENGVPVKLMTLQTEDFSKALQYNGKLTGKNQGTEQSMLSGQVEEIYYKEGDYVEEGTTILSFPDDLTGANYQAVKANYDVTKASFNRLSELYKEGGISQQELDNVDAAYQAAASQFSTVEQMLRITASISGYITAIYVSETDYIEPGDLLFTVSNMSSLKTEVLVTEKEISFFKKGVSAVALWEGITYNGEVTGVGFAMNDRLGAFEVDLEFANPENIMRTNINAVIEVNVYSKSDVIVLEKKHLSQDAQGDYVFVRKADKVEKRYIELGNSEGVRFEVVSGLSAGEEIVVEGKELLHDQSLILIKK